MEAVAEQKRFCEHCSKAKPITEFRRRYRNRSDRLNQCNTCHNEAEKERRKNRRVKCDNEEVAQFNRMVKNGTRPEQVEAAIGAIINYFGGIKRFVSAWIRHFEIACIQHPGSKRTLDVLQAVVRMLEYHEARLVKEEQDDDERRSLLTDEELEQEMMEYVKNLVRAHPEMAIDAARELGWTLIPRSEVEQDREPDDWR